MESEYPSPPHHWAPPAVALVLLVAAWGTDVTGRRAADRLDLSRFGRAEDVPEALARDAYVSAYLCRYFAAAAVLDVAAVGASVWALVRGRAPAVGLALAVAATASLAWHGYGFVVTMPDAVAVTHE